MVNIATIFFPFLLSFEKKLKFYKKWSFVFLSMVIVGIPFLIWDAIAASRGDWSFNAAYTLNINILGLPIEEILFFITVPYAILFLYETYLFYIPKNKWEIDFRFFIIPLLLSVFTAIIFSNKYYTLTVFSFLSFLFILLLITKPIFLRQKYFGVFLLFSFIPFGIENYILTSVPIVTYNASSIWGIRITAIPLEDFFYSFTLVTLYIYFYELSKEKWKRKTVQ